MVKKEKIKKSDITEYIIEGEIKNSKTCLYVLAGYKPYLWEDVFSRIKKFQINDMDVCIASSGLYSEELSLICKKNNWVYLSTSLNNVCAVLNVVMNEFNSAEYVFKLDEDIFIPKDYFKDMLYAYNEIESKEPVEIGYICPFLPLGFYGMHEFLLLTNSLEEYEKKFGRHKIGGTALNPCFREACGVDEFIWEKIGIFDKRAAEFKYKGIRYEACCSRTGIAAILFKREMWNRMVEAGGIVVNSGSGVGNTGDEGQITSFCAVHFQIIYCVKSILVGHFSFGGAEKNVMKLREKKPQYFEIYGGINEEC